MGVGLGLRLVAGLEAGGVRAASSLLRLGQLACVPPQHLVSTAIVSIATVGIAIVSTAIVSIAIVSIAMVRIAIVSMP